MLNVYLPFCASSTCSALPVSTLYIEILPSFSPEITYLLHGEKPTVHRSTGPNVSMCFFSLVLALHRHMLESSELLAMAVEECTFNLSPATPALALHLLWPSELTATETTPSAWPFNWCRSFSVLSSRTSHTLTRSSRPPVTIKSFGFGSFLSKSNGFSSSGGVFSSPALAGSGSRPQAHAQSAFSWAFSSLCNNENYKWTHWSRNLALTYIRNLY